MININNLYKNFHNLQVLKGVSLSVKPQEKVVIIGSSGSGKSTLLRCINLLEKPTFGEIYVQDKLLTPVDPYLHEDIIKKSNTFKKLMKELNDEKQVIKLIKEKGKITEFNPLKNINTIIKNMFDEYKYESGVVELLNKELFYKKVNVILNKEITSLKSKNDKFLVSVS